MHVNFSFHAVFITKSASMASVISDPASSDVPDGQELELLVEIATDVDSQLPANEAQWIDLLMTAYDAKVRLLPPSTSTSKLFHWVRRIAQLRQPGQLIWDCFKSICEESDIQLDFEPSTPIVLAPNLAQVDQSKHKQSVLARSRITSSTGGQESSISRPSQPQTSRHPDVLQDLDPLAPRSALGTRDNGLNYRQVSTRPSRSSKSVPSSQPLGSVPHKRVSNGLESLESVQVPTMPGDRFYPLKVQDFGLLDYFTPEEIEEVAVARRHLIRRKAFAGWRGYSINNHLEQAASNLDDGADDNEKVQRRRLIAESRLVALKHAPNRQKTEHEDKVIRPSKPQLTPFLNDIVQLENITEEATLDDTALSPQNPVIHMTSAAAVLQTLENASRWQVPEETGVDGSSKQQSHALLVEEQHTISVANAQELLQQARNGKAELFFEAWRRKTHAKAQQTYTQYQMAKEVKAESYVQLWRERVRRKRGRECDSMRQVREMKTNLVFEGWNKHTRLYAVIEDNDRMYAEQCVVKWHARSKRRNHLQEMVENHKYQWACELTWQILSQHKDHLSHLEGLVDLVQYYRNAIEPFNAWRIVSKTRHNEKLAGAYRDARRAFKSLTVNKHLKTWHAKIAEQKALSENARAEIKTIRSSTIFFVMKDHLQRLDRLDLLKPLAREQAVLLHVEHRVDKWRDRARQWRAMKRLANEMQQENRERVALEGFRQWRAKTRALLEAQRDASEGHEFLNEKQELQEGRSMAEPQTPQPAFRWKSRLTEGLATPKTAPAIRSKNARRLNQTPRILQQLGTETLVSTPQAFRSATREFTASTALLAPETIRAPQTLPSKQRLLDPAAAPFRTPRKGKGMLFTDPVFFQKLQQVMPEHALLNERT